MHTRQLGTLAVLLAAACPVAAQEEGGWSVSSRNRPAGGVAVLCAMSLPAAAGPAQLSLTNQPQPNAKPAAGAAKRGLANLRVSVPDKVIAVRRGDVGGVSFSIEGQKTWSGVTAQWVEAGSGGVLQAVVESDVEAFLKPLARGSTLEVSVTPPGGAAKSYSVNLAGSGAAVAAFRDCLAQIR